MEAHRITDFAHPRLPLAVRACNLVGRPLARRGLRLDSEHLLATARRRAGLADFGDAAFREPLDALRFYQERFEVSEE